MPFRACVVSFVDRNGQKHTAEVDAETVYEAAALAIRSFESRRRYIKGPSRHATLEGEVNKPARLLVELKVQQVIDWLYVTPAKNDAEKTRKARLKGLLNDDRH
jgi:hypothetical protein